jgi:exodeoxyribonuclease V gamma subunit
MAPAVLTLHAGNRIERLADRLAEVLSEPVGPVLAPETVVVPGAGLARWLAGRIARRNGVCANLRFALPAAFIWECFRAVLPRVPASAGFAPGPIAWRAFAALGELAGAPGFEAVGRYLAGGDELKRWRLARRLAEVFDQYQVYRPDWVRAWERGEGGDWQAVLWRHLSAAGEGRHWVQAHDAFLAALSGAAGAGVLPPRVALFALPALSPTYLDLVTRIADASEAHLFTLNPSREFWGDLESPAALARQRARWRRRGLPDASGYFALGNPLLASLGRMGRDYVARLAGLEGWEEEHFEVPPQGRLLGALQADLLALRAPAEGPARAVAPGDDSIQVHACHSRLREVQVLHDRLLDLFERLPGLAPREVLVAAPDMDAYGPFVAAVFGAPGEERGLPWSLGWGSPAAADPLLATVLELLGLPASRLAASEVVGLLEVPAVMRRFGLDPDGVARVRAWVRESGVRWGADDEARSALGLPGFDANSWAFGLRRLFLGYALPAGDPPYRGVDPYPHVEGAAARDLGGLQAFVDRLRAWQGRLARAGTVPEWGERLGRLLQDLLAPDPDEVERLQELRDAAAALTEEAASAGFGAAVGREVYLGRLGEALAARAGGAPRLGGGVSFGSLAALRGIPARVVCVLGLNGADFPRIERPPGFDRMARERRPGDRSRREEDRQLFLDALLAARDVLYLSYVGRSARDNAALPPSVVVSELLDYLARAFRWDGDGPERALVTEHPLQPFSRRYFDGSDPRLYSFARQWLPGRGEGAGGAPGPFADRPLAGPARVSGAVELDDLVRFFQNPARGYLEGLGVRLPEEQAPLEDVEAFGLDRLARFRLREEALDRALAGEPFGEGLLERLRARGEIPVGMAGERALREALAPVGALASALREALAEAREPLDVEVTLGSETLRGRLAPLVADGLLAWRPGKLRPRDQVGLWLRHLALNAVAAAPVARASRFLAEDRSLQLAPVADAAGRLVRLLDLYREGLAAPLPFYPGAALAYARALARGKSLEEARACARRAWGGSREVPGERDDPYVAVAQRGREPLDARFEALALEVLGPMLAVAGEAQGEADASA